MQQNDEFAIFCMNSVASILLHLRDILVSLQYNAITGTTKGNNI